jgi:hypothetical protein
MGADDLDELYNFPTVRESEQKIREKAPEVIERIKSHGGEDLLEMLGLEGIEEWTTNSENQKPSRALPRRYQTLRQR